MVSCYSGDHIAEDHIHTDITTCNTDELQQKYRLGTVSCRLLDSGLKGWILCYTVDPPNLIPSNRQVIRRSKVSANHLIIRVIKYCRAETTARFRGPSGVYLLT